MVNSKLSKKSLKSRSLKLKNKRTKKSKVSRKNVRKMKGGLITNIDDAKKRLVDLIYLNQNRKYIEIINLETDITGDFKLKIDDLTIDILNKKRKKIILYYHPDKYKSTELEKTMEECFKIVSTALNKLKSELEGDSTPDQEQSGWPDENENTDWEAKMLENESKRRGMTVAAIIAERKQREENNRKRNREWKLLTPEERYAIHQKIRERLEREAEEKERREREAEERERRERIEAEEREKRERIEAEERERRERIEAEKLKASSNPSISPSKLKEFTNDSLENIIRIIKKNIVDERARITKEENIAPFIDGIKELLDSSIHQLIYDDHFLHKKYASESGDPNSKIFKKIKDKILHFLDLTEEEMRTTIISAEDMNQTPPSSSSNILTSLFAKNTVNGPTTSTFYTSKGYGERYLKYLKP